MQDAWRAYLEVALGLTEASRKKAQKIAGELVGRGGATAAQVQGLVEDMMSVGMANREALTKIVRLEVDRALGVVGLATADEVAELNDRVRDLEGQLRQARARVAAETTGTAASTGGPSAAVDGDAAGVATTLHGPSGPGLSGPYRAADGSPPSATQLDAPMPLPRATKAAGKAVAKKVAKKTARKVAGPATPDSAVPDPAAPDSAGADSAAGKELVKRPGTAVAERAPEKKAVAKKTTAKKTAKKAAARKTAGTNTTGTNTSVRKATPPAAGADES